MIDDTPMPARPVAWEAFRRELEVLYSAGAPATRSKVRQVCDAIGSLGVTRVDQLDVDLIARFVASRPAGQSPHTLRSLLGTLSAICTVAWDKDYVRVSPFSLRSGRMSRWVKLPPLRGKRCPSPAEVKALLGSLRAEIDAGAGWSGWRARRLLALASVVALAGPRLGEAARLQIGDVDHAAGEIHIRPHGRRLKTANSEATVCMPRALSAALLAWEPHRLQHPLWMTIPDEVPWLFPGAMRRGPWTGGTWGHRPTEQLEDAGERAGIGKVTFQQLRRAFTTAAIAAGVPLELAARQARHAPEVARAFYADKSVQELKSALADFDYR